MINPFFQIIEIFIFYNLSYFLPITEAGQVRHVYSFKSPEEKKSDFPLIDRRYMWFNI